MRSPTSPRSAASRRDARGKAGTSVSACACSPRRHPALPTTAPRSAPARRHARPNRRARDSSSTAPSACSRASSRTARATRPRWPSSRPTASASRSSRLGSCTATPAMTPFNAVGTGGSRAATLASGAVVGAVAVFREQHRRAFAEQHELDPRDVEVGGGHGAARAASPRRRGIWPGSPSRRRPLGGDSPTSPSPTAAGPSPRTAAGWRSTSPPAS